MKLLRYVLFGCFLGLTGVLFARTFTKDSLQTLLNNTEDTQRRVDILLNLLDLAESAPDEYPCAVKLYEEAFKQNDKYALASTLGAITIHFLTNSASKDSLYQYLERADDLLKGSEYDGITTYYRMTCKARIIDEVERDKLVETCDEITASLEKNKTNENTYEKVERLFLNGIITYKLMTLAEKQDWNKGLPYWEEAWKTVRSFPLMTRRNFSANLMVCLMTAYGMDKNKEKIIETANTYLDWTDEYFNSDDVEFRRPYMSKELTYLLCYQRMISSVDIIGKEMAEKYYRRYRKFMNGGKGDAISRDKTYFFDISSSYYLTCKNYEKALAYRDSLIHLIEIGKSRVTSVFYHYKKRADILEEWGRYKDACSAYRRAIVVNDSLAEQKYITKVSEMRVKLDVDKLELDNATLLAEKRKAALNFSICIIVIIVAISIYLYLNLKRIKKLQKNLLKESARAEESENMKKAFINSMCHEIRTPLNAICGFSELIVDESMDAEDKKEFPEIIRDNTKVLTSLLDDLLEVANLDNSSGAFPMEKVDVNVICINEMKRLRTTENKAGIDYFLELPEHGCIINTHPKYFSLMIGALLNNANKFTESGQISLTCKIDKDKKEAIFSLTDTGCGIPLDKQKFVFERFAKLDTFKQGTGLGLYLCQIIINRMGGRIWIDPEYVSGTRFIFTVPLL